MTVEFREPTDEERAILCNIAKSFSKSYSVIDADDIFQTMALKWYTKFSSFAPYLEMPDDDRIPLLIRTFQTWGIQYCRSELAEFRKLHPQPDDFYFYSRDQIRAMLPFVEDPVTWSSFSRTQEEGERRNRIDPALGNNALAHYSDLRIAWDGLLAAERSVLRSRYIDNLDYPEVAQRHQITEAYARKRVERGISHLQKAMGCETRSRKVLSNATAQVVTRREYEGA